MQSDLISVKQNTNLLAIASRDTVLKRVAGTNGGEWAGPCPFCHAGEDRFRLQPYHKNGARWWCRYCGGGKWNDSLDYIERRDHVSLKDALKFLESEYAYSLGSSLQQKKEETKTEASQEIDRAKWCSAALNFVDECCATLWKDCANETRAYLSGRGLTEEVLRNAYIGWNEVEGFDDPNVWGLNADDTMRLNRGITIPYIDSAGIHAINVRRPSGDPRYLLLRGSERWLYGAETFKTSSIAIVFEAELDSLCALGTGLVLGYGAFPAGQSIDPAWQLFFDGVEDLIIAFDEDQPGRDATEKLISLSRYFHKADPLPMGKDLGEYFQAGGDVLEWLMECLSLIGGNDGT